MSWQAELHQELIDRLPPTATTEVLGSAAGAAAPDGWSDLDLRVALPADGARVPLFTSGEVWAIDDNRSPENRVIRAVLADGRRVDLIISGATVDLPDPAVDNEVRFLAALAAAKLGRGDRLIGSHLLLEVARAALVQAMLLRDRDLGTTVHRHGSRRDALAGELLTLLNNPLEVTVRPTVIEQVVERYGRWRCELEPDYRPDWSGLRAVLDRGGRSG